MKTVEKIDFNLREDDRGWVAYPFIEALLKNRAITNIHIPCLRPGSVRGNHYHLHAIEFALVLSGPCRAVFYDNRTGEILELTVSGDKPELFKIPSNTAHAFKNIGDHDIFLICYETPACGNRKHDIYSRHIMS